MHIDLDEDNARRYSKASFDAKISANQIINAILRSIEEVSIDEIIKIKLKKDSVDEQKTGRPRLMRKESSWKVRLF